MTLEKIYQLVIKLGIESDLRGKSTVIKNQKRLKEKYEKLSGDKKKEFDKECLINPYSDTRILYGKLDQPIKTVLVGIDINTAELLLAKHLIDNGQPIDLVISHHPLGQGLAALDEVMHLQAEVLSMYGVPINVAEGLLKTRISEVSRGISGSNHYRAVDTAKLLKIPLMCAHTVCDNLAANFLKQKIQRAKPEFVDDLLKLLKNIPEYTTAVKQKAGPRLFAGNEDNHTGKIALTEITGGTEGSPQIYEKMAQVGIGTVVGMHMSEEHKKEAEKNHINAVVAGHMSSDSIGVNLFLDELEKRGVKIIPCSGLIRVSRAKK